MHLLVNNLKFHYIAQVDSATIAFRKWCGVK